MNFIFALISFAFAAQINQDFVTLQSFLRLFIEQDRDRRIPELVRLSFHDLAAFTNSNNMGPNGCILNQTIQSIPDNAGLASIVSSLAKQVASAFPDTEYRFGDVVSLAGKTAVETAYPCLQIQWSFGRETCDSTKILHPGQIPNGSMTSVAQLKPFLDRYNLSFNEMNVLFAGAHGIRNAMANSSNSGFGTRPFSLVNSGKDWIEKTVGPWAFNSSPKGNTQFLNFDLEIIRLPSDFIGFPSQQSAPGGGASNIEPEAKKCEAYMRSFLNVDRSVFDQEFARVYSKMLNIGVDPTQLTEFIEPISDLRPSKCLDT